jgi:hypothetical protein
MKTKIRHGNSVPLPSDLCRYQLGFSDLNNHLYIKNGHDDVIDIMGWISAGTGKKVDTLQDFFGEIVWRMYFEGTGVIDSTVITYATFYELFEKDVNNNSIPISIKWLVGHGGFGLFHDTSDNFDFQRPFGCYNETDGSRLHSTMLSPIIKNGKLCIEVARHTARVSENFSYKVYVDFTDGSVRTQQ